MKKSTLAKLLVVAGVASSLTGCATYPFIPKSLNDNAKGIATVRSVPYGCKVLGEVEGKDELPSGVAPINVYDNTYDRVREGALNDVRNKAVDVIGNNKKRTVIYIANEEHKCFVGDCDKKEGLVFFYKVAAQIFECGTKE